MSLVVHFEIHATDPEKSIAFYSELFGWSFSAVPGMPYWIIDTGEGAARMDQPGSGINGGLVKRMGEAPPVGGPVTGANLVVGVDNPDATMAKGLELGGIEAMAVSDVPGVGRFGYLLDPDNNVFGFISNILSDGTDATANPIEM